MNEKNTFYMKRAIELSKNNMLAGKGGPFGAVIVKDNKIIGEGYNQVIEKNDPTAHAEISAIRNAAKFLNSFDLNGSILYTSCEPCPMCLGAIYWANIKEIYYANTKEDAAAINFNDNFIYEELNKDISERKIRFNRIMREEAQKIFTLWENKIDKIQY